MHSTKIGDYTFIHDGIHSPGSENGNVIIAAVDMRVTVPIPVLIEFVAEIVRKKRIAELEDASPLGILMGGK